MTLMRMLLITVLAATCQARPNKEGAKMPKRKYPPPGSGFRSRDIQTNLTMDGIMTKLLGGVQGASNKLMAGGSVQVELDLLLTMEQYMAIYGKERHGGRQKRKAVKDTVYRWTNGEIPYVFGDNTFSSKDRFMILESLTEWERYTCVNFKPATSSHHNRLHFVIGNSCSSQLGMVGGRQYLTLVAPGCRFRGLYLHETGHALGLIHEHQRPDRDNYIDILLDKVSPSLRYNFLKYSYDKASLVNTTYEYSSIMHYSIKAFSADGKSQTIRTKDPSREEEIGQTYLKELAFNDVKAVNNMYGCSELCTKKVVCEDGGYVDQNCRCICPDGSRDCEVGYESNKTKADCTNKYDDWQCFIWANSGQCDRNSKFMSEYCRKACDKCESASAEPSTKDDCQDLHVSSKCEKWKTRGDCASNEWWMSRNCRKTCNACVDKDNRPETNCSNTHNQPDKCDDWAKDGECQINPVFMLDKCSRSCQTCGQSPPEVNETGPCEDIHSETECSAWADSGECEANPGWMLVNCEKSCGQCGTIPLNETCENKYEKCSEWAGQGGCLSRSDWMKTNCMVSCGVCEPEPGYTKPVTMPTTQTVTPGVCDDNYRDKSSCREWANSGECENNPNWMLRNCMKSCGLCEQSTTTTVTETGKCEDTHHDKTACKKWAAANHCEVNPSWMLTYCKESCGVCVGETTTSPSVTQGPCENSYFDLECDNWAETGHCEINPDWMHENCRKACKLCEDVTPSPVPTTPEIPVCACDLIRSGAVRAESVLVPLVGMFSLLIFNL